MPRVSVIVATYRRAPLLAEALASVRGQSSGEWETIVCDDGSDDGTRAVVEDLGRSDPRIQYLGLAHSGSHGRVRNAGIRASSSPLVAFLDDDDLWLPGTLGRLVARLQEAPELALVFGRVERFGGAKGLWPRRAPPSRPHLSDLLRGNFVPLSTVCARREALLAAGLFPEEVVATPDYELWLRLLRRSPIAFEPAVLARYRVHAGNMSQHRRTEAAELERLYDRIELEWDLPGSLLAPARRGIARLRARLAPRLGESLRWWIRSLRDT